MRRDFWPGLQAMNTDPNRLIGEICDVARTAGGWALFGGVRLITELSVGRCEDPRYLALMDDALLFLQSQGAS